MYDARLPDCCLWNCFVSFRRSWVITSLEMLPARLQSTLRIRQVPPARSIAPIETQGRQSVDRPEWTPISWPSHTHSLTVACCWC